MARVITAIPGLSDFYSGTITIQPNLVSGDIGVWDEAIPDKGINYALVSSLGCSVGYIIMSDVDWSSTHDPNEFDDDKDENGVSLRDICGIFNTACARPLSAWQTIGIWKSYATAGAVTKFKYYYVIWVSDADGEEYTAPYIYSDPGTLSSGYSLGFNNVKIVRDVTDISPDDRGPMHVTDFAAGDALYVDGDFEIQASFDGMTCVSTSEQYQDADEITPDDMITGDIAFWKITSSIVYHGDLVAGVNYANVSVSSGGIPVDLSILDAPTNDARADAIGSGSGWTINVLTGGFYTCGYGWSIGTPLIWGYEPYGAEFLDESGFDPLVGDSFFDDNDNEVFYLLSQLPSQYVDVPLYFMDNNRNAFPQPRKRSATYAPYVSQQWAWDNYYNQTLTTENDDIGIETHNDNFISVYVPGIQETTGTANPIYNNLVSFNRAELTEVSFRSSNLFVSSDTDNLTVAGQVFTILQDTNAAKSVSRNQATRYYNRMALMGQIPGTGKHWQNPWRFKSYAENLGTYSADELADPTLCFAEDTYCWKDYSFLHLQFTIGTIPVDVVDFELEMSLNINYSVPSVSDPHYTCGSERAEEYEVSYTTYDISYPFILSEAENEHWIDLLCPSNGTTPQLWIVNSLSFVGFLNSSQTGSIDITLDAIQLVSDQGKDHTGRDITATLTEDDWKDQIRVKQWDNWDFLSDFTGLSVYYEGIPHITWLPMEPFLGGSPEDGFGSIEPLVHCPTSTSSGLLHYMRPLGSVGVLNDGGEGWTIALDQTQLDAMTIGTSDTGITPTTMVEPVMCWTENWMDEKPNIGETPTEIVGGIHCRSWGQTRGIPYKCYFRKIGGGSIHGLLKTTGGLRRFTKTDCIDHEIVIWQRITYYDDYDEPIAAPAGLEPSGVWTQSFSSLLSPYLNYQGWMSIDSGFRPAKVYFEPDVYTATYAITEYYGQIWENNDWQDYDINIAADLADMLDLSIGQFSFEPKSRRWNGTVFNVVLSNLGRIDMVYGVQDGVILVRDARIDFNSQFGPNPVPSLYTSTISRWVSGYTEFWFQHHSGFYNPSVAYLDDGTTWVAANDDFGVQVFRRDSIGKVLSTPVDKYEGYSHPTIRINPATEEIVLLMIYNPTQKVQSKRIISQTDGSYDWEGINDNLGETDFVSPALAMLDDNTWISILCKNDTLHIYSSGSDGASWSEETSTISLVGYTCPALLKDKHLNSLYLFVLNTATDYIDLLEIYSKQVAGNRAWDCRIINASLFNSDKTTAAVEYSPDGVMWIAVALDSNITMHWSNDNGLSWT